MSETDQRTRIGRLIDKRADELGLSLNDVADAAGISRQSLLNIRSGKTRKVRSANARGLERALQWPAGAIFRIVAGEEPDELPADSGADVVIRNPDGTTTYMRIKHAPPGSHIEEAVVQALQEKGFAVAVQLLGTDAKEAPPALAAGGAILAGASAQGPDVTAEEILNDPDLPEPVRRALLDGFRRVREEVAEELRKTNS